MSSRSHVRDVFRSIGAMYLSIQDIDLCTDGIRLVRWDHGEGSGPDVEPSHAGAQAELRALCEDGVDEVSLDAMRPFVDLSTLAERLDQADTVAVEYLSAQGCWCRARFVAAERDADGRVTRVLWLIESIEEEKRQRDELKSLSEKDSLTGVRSKHAYLTRERELDEIISSGDAGEFSMVVCDVNDLKKVNDTYGRKAGDDHIREACRMVCEIFQHSPVFRVGGDEFAAILTGRDHAIRRQLMVALHERSVDHIRGVGPWSRAGSPTSDPAKIPTPATCSNAPTSACTRIRRPSRS